MDSDLALVVGIIVFALTFPAIVSSYSSGRPASMALICFMVGGAFIAYAVHRAPDAYHFQELPGVFARTFGRYVN